MNSPKVVKKKQRHESSGHAATNTSITLPVRSKNGKFHVNEIRSRERVAFLKGSRVVVDGDRQFSKLLFYFGCFGKGELSRGTPGQELQVATHRTSDLPDDHSIDVKMLVPISNESYTNRLEWEKLLTKTDESSTTDDQSFHQQFMREMIKDKLRILDSSSSLLSDEYNRYYKVKFVDRMNELTFINDDENVDEKKSNENGPFCFKIKRIPKVTLNEGLALMFEEAFFLNYGLDCLTIKRQHDDDDTMTPAELWSQFVAFDRRFPFKYACYHKLRSKGWIVKCGLKYGCDFLLYYGGPDRYHASYAVRVIPIDLSRLSANESNGFDDFTQFSSLIRINETVSKEQIMCYVIYESGTVDLTTPKCLPQMVIMETLVKRWVPSHNNNNNNSNNNVIQLESTKTS